MESKTETTQETQGTEQNHEKHEHEEHDIPDFGRMLLTLAGLSLMEKMGSGELHIIVIGSANDDEDEENDGGEKDTDGESDENAA